MFNEGRNDIVLWVDSGCFEFVLDVSDLFLDLSFILDLSGKWFIGNLGVF